MSTKYIFHLDEKVSIWQRSTLEVFAESQEEANEIIKAASNEGNEMDYQVSTEYLYDTVDNSNGYEILDESGNQIVDKLI